jgi:hypothetical protein
VLPLQRKKGKEKEKVDESENVLRCEEGDEDKIGLL